VPEEVPEVAAAAAEPGLPTAEPEPEPIAPPEPPPLAIPPPLVVPPPLAAAPAAAPAPELRLPLVVPGTQRVVVHTVEGQAKRGVLQDADLAGAALALAPQPGQAGEPIATEKVKAIFFMLAPGEKPPVAEGKKVRVTFRDGRQVAGFSPDYAETGAGFFMIPGDTRTNTGRIWVYRAAVRQVAVSS
jgi:hypothetical protein